MRWLKFAGWGLGVVAVAAILSDSHHVEIAGAGVMLYLLIGAAASVFRT